jgi:hypothetical protein
MLRSCGSAPVVDPTSPPDAPVLIAGIKVKDAASQGVIVEIATLLWTVHQQLGTDHTVAYFEPMLSSLGWSQPAILTFLAQLTEPNLAQGMYRDKFRLFVRTCQ